MRASLKLVVAFIAAGIGMWAWTGYLQSNDDALPGIQAFLAKTEKVTSVIGDNPTIAVHNSLFYQGVPGKERPYREYRVTAKGGRGAVDVTVRATRPEGEGSWSYQIRAFNE